MADNQFTTGEVLTVANDRRNSYRLALKAGQGWIDVPASRAALQDLNISGGGLILTTNQPDILTKAPVQFHLKHFPTFEAQIVPVRTLNKEHGRLEVGFRFQKLHQNAIASLAQFLIERYIEKSRDQPPPHLNPIKALCVKDLGLRRRLLRFYAIGRSIPLEVYLEDVILPVHLTVKDLIIESGQEYIQAEIPLGDDDMLEEGEEYTFTFAGERAINYFHAAILQIKDDMALLPLPEEIWQTGFRSSLRFRPLPEEMLGATLIDPKLPNGTLIKPITDLGSGGFALPIDASQDLLFPGERIQEVVLNLPAGPVHVECIVRSIRRQKKGHYIFGMEILDYASAGEAERWKKHIFHAAHPRLKIAGPELVAEAWKVLEKSAYLEEATPALRPHLAKQFYYSWSKHTETGQVGRLLLLVKEQQAVGTLSANLLYPGTWIIHHLGINEEERKRDLHTLIDLAKELYCGISHMFRHMLPLEHFVLYVNAQKSWNRMMYGRFLKYYPNKEDFSYDCFKVYKCNPFEIASDLGNRQSPIEIIDADEQLIKILSQHVQKNFSPIEIKALSYDEDVINLKEFSESCKILNYERTRSIFFAVYGGKPIAALITETGEEGVNTFSLINSCRIIRLESVGIDSVVKKHLLQYAQNYYAKLGKKEFIYFENASVNDSETLELLGIAYQVNVFRWLGHRDIIPPYLSYLEDFLEIFRG